MSKFYSRWKRPLVRTEILSGLSKYPAYLRDWLRYRRMYGAESIRLRDTHPCLFDRAAKTSVDSHYFYQHVWAFEKIYSLRPKVHVDVGSSVDFVGLLSVVTKVRFVDIRPLEVSNVPNIESVKGSILALPYEDNSLESVSSLHVAEHIGLGRYGDPLDPLGTQKAAAELSRCLAQGGSLLFSVPVGKPRLCFNAHRIHSPGQILRYFDGLKLVEFSGSDDNKTFMRNIEPGALENSKYACGFFWFRKD